MRSLLTCAFAKSSPVLLAYLVLGPAVPGCSSDPEIRPPVAIEEAKANAFDGTYSIRAYVMNEGKVQDLAFVAAAPSSDQPLSTVGASSLKVLDTPYQSPIPPSATGSVANGNAPVGDLARMAIADCGSHAGSFVAASTTGTSCQHLQFVNGRPYEQVSTLNSFTTPANSLIPQNLAPTATSPSCPVQASPRAFIYFWDEPRTAQQVLQFQETLVCAASRLAQLADSEKPVTWQYALNGLHVRTPVTSVSIGGRLQNPETSIVDLPTYPLIKPEVLNDANPLYAFFGAQPYFPPVTFRVVQPNDRFLVRDMAIELLSYVPLLDQFPIVVPTPGVGNPVARSAADLFVQSAAGTPGPGVLAATYNVTATNTVTPSNAGLFYPPISGTVAGSVFTPDYPKTARKHLEMESANLRAASTLMQDLIEKNVNGAYSGALQKAAKLPASEKGKAFWADGTDGNSVNQIAKTLFGRQGTLGMAPAGTPVSSTNCAGTGRDALQNVWTSSTAPIGLSYRGTDIAVTTRQAELADALLARSQFLPLATATAAQTRTGMFTALRDTMATAAGLTPTTYDGSIAGLRLKSSFAGLTDEDVLIAKQRQATYLQLLSNQGASSATQLSALGLTSTTATASGTLAGGAKMNLPVLRAAGTADVMGAMAKVQMASECTGAVAAELVNTSGTTLNVIEGNAITPVTNTGRTAGVIFTPRQRSYQFQDAFAVGQALRERMVRLRSLASATTFGNPNDEEVQARSAAIVETEAWAGSTRVVVAPAAAGTDFIVSIFDADPAEFGLPAAPSIPQVVAAFAMAIENPTQPAGDGDLAVLSQCISRTRNFGCPVNANNYRWLPVAAGSSVTTSAATSTGRLRHRYDLAFPRATASAGSVPSFVVGPTSVAVAKMAKSVIRLGGTGGSGGMVLGATKAPDPLNLTVAQDLATSFAVSPLRRSLVTDVFGYSTTGFGNVIASPMSCIKGVPNDLFVPLENELTSDGDGYESAWKHYITIAKANAQKADELGRELIEIGTRIEERKETAYDLARDLLRGDFDKSCLELDDGNTTMATQASGKRTYAKCPAEVQAGLSNDVFDVVLLTDPPPGKTLVDLLECNTLGVARANICDKLASGAVERWVDPKSTEVTTREVGNFVYYTSLNSGKTTEVPMPPNLDDCKYPQSDTESYIVKNLTTEDGALDDEGVRQSLRRARFVVDGDGNFQLLSGSTIVADSRSPALQPAGLPKAWPGCLEDASCNFSATGPTARQGTINNALHSMFRTCPGFTTALGTCDAPTNSRWEEVNGIRWRMMGALWSSLSLSGKVPAGAFDLPIPAINIPPGSTNVALPGVGTNVCTMPVTAYGTMQFGGSPTNRILAGSEPLLNDQDFSVMSGTGRLAVDVSPNFAALPSSAANEMPFWLRAIYSQNEPGGIDACFRTGRTGLGGLSISYVHVRGVNEQLLTNTNWPDLLQWLGSSGAAGAAGGSRGIALEGWKAMARRGKAGDADFPKYLASAKTAFFDSSPSFLYYRERTIEFDPVVGQLKVKSPQNHVVSAQYWGRTYRGPEGIDEPGGPFQRFKASPRALGDEMPTELRSAEYDAQGDGVGDPVYPASLQFRCTISDYTNMSFCLLPAPYYGMNSASPLFPRNQPPSFRTRFFANSLAPKGLADAKRQLAGAAGLACLLTKGQAQFDEGETPPTIRSVDDARAITAWLGGRERAGLKILSRAHVENVPMQLMAALRADNISVGQQPSQIADAMSDVLTLMRGIGGSYAKAMNSISQARTQVRGLELTVASIDAKQNETEAANAIELLRSSIEINAEIARAAGGNNKSYGGSTSASSLQNLISIRDISATKLAPARVAAIEATRALAFLTAFDRFGDFAVQQSDAILDMQAKASQLDNRLRQIQGMKNGLAGALERAQGLNAWTCTDVTGADIVCRSYVNGVLNARYSGTRIRYEKALLAARTSAFFAKKAVEQRLGVRLDSFKRPLGTLEAPAQWADRVCSMRGVDFKGLVAKLKTQTAPINAAEKQAWDDLRGGEYADSFIGDYVDLLSNFVEAYNVSYPSQDGSDTALISLRENVLRANGECEGPSLNRLRNSDALGSAARQAQQEMNDGAWYVHKCTEAKCVDASQWTPPANIGLPPPQLLVAGWLRTRPLGTGAASEQGAAGPSGFVSQQVALPSGSYVLSFQDGAVNSSGIVTTTPTAYRVSVLDADGSQRATQVNTPLPGVIVMTPPGAYPTYTLRKLSFKVTSPTVVSIAFAPAANSGDDGSMLIAQPQLERDDLGRGPTKYQATSAAGTSQNLSCASSPAELRAKFKRKCDATDKVGAPARCYYETRDAFTMNTDSLTINGNSLADIVAADNYNYRHVDFALNLVGAGVRDCDETQTPGCYASGIVEYDIVHEGNLVPIVGYDREIQRFSFGEGAVRHGKALSAEKYLTLPLTPGDTGLLSATGVTKTELRGRPLDGRYRIRIYENQALRWGRLEDIQLMIRYRYWSRVLGTKRP
jgi:hypothetical protein